LESEYNVKTVFTSLPYSVAKRVVGEADAIARAQLPSNAKLVEDWDGNAVALFESEWSLRLAEEWNASLKFIDGSEMATPEAVSR
jgi:peptide subunit release factor RF-3